MLLMILWMLHYGRDFRCRQDADTWVYEASVSYTPDPPDPPEPMERRRLVRRWKTEPTNSRLARARAAALRRYNRICLHCGRPCNLGSMHDKDTILCAGAARGFFY